MPSIAATLSYRNLPADGQARLQLWTSAVTGLPPELLLMRQLPVVGTGNDLDLVRVCTLADLYNYTTLGTQVFRRQSADLLFSNAADRTEFREKLQEQLTQLLADAAYFTDTADPAPALFELSDAYTLEVTTLVNSDTALHRLKVRLLDVQAEEADTAVPVFVVSCDDLAKGTNEYELVSVASPEDMTAYGETPSESSLFRVSSLTLYANDNDQAKKLLGALQEDLQAALDGLSGVSSTPGTLTATVTCTNTPVLPV